MSTLHDLDTYVRSQSRRRKRTNGAAEPANGNGTRKTALAQSYARSRAFARGGRPRAVALTRPLDYEIPSPVAPLRQPSSMACWATTFTMMVSWRDRVSRSAEETLGRIGQKWVDLLRANTGATAAQEAELYAAAGLVAEPLANHSLETWERMLREFGPLNVIVDVNPSQARAIHMLVLTGIHGDGTSAGTNLTIVDPARGDSRRVPFATFLDQYQQGAARRSATGRHNQIIHWPKDAKFAGTKGLEPVRAFTTPPAKVPAPATPPAPQPWSHYFPFRKGSRYDIDGPLTYNGTGEVLERTADYVKFTMKMPAVSIFGYDIPAADMVLEATYRREGRGNHVRATINGAVMEDTDAEIVSSGRTRTIRPRFTGAAGPLPEWITVAPDGDNEIDLDMRIDGREVDFDLERTSGSSGMALGIDPWSRFFPFGAGTAFEADGPLKYDGRGRVHERSDTFLKFEMNMPAAKIAGHDLPKLDLVLEATYGKEGPGNRVDLTINGTKHGDANASIVSDGARNRRTIIPSIPIGDGQIQKLSFAPDGRDEIDLDVTIKGSEHDFNLTKVKGSAAQSWVRGFASSSTPAAALSEVAAFAARSTPTRWKLSRADVATRLRTLVGNADLVDQGGLNLCGPAAFFHLLARRDPVAFVRYAADLFEKGAGTIGTLRVKPDDDLVLNAYATLVTRMSPVTPPAEWMCLSALRDSENAIIDFHGDPSENVAGMTTPAELAKWMRASGIYTTVTEDANWMLTKGLPHATALAPAPNRDIVMLINANLISGAAPGRKKLVDAFPNHYVQLLSPVTSPAPTRVEFDCWTWGMAGRMHAVVTASDFVANYYGTVTGQV